MAVGTEFISGEKDVALAITPEPLVSSRNEVNDVLIIGKDTNTDVIRLVGTSSDTKGIPLNPGQPVSLAAEWSMDTIDLNCVILRAAVDGEGVEFFARK
jgi:hypothetical protein